MKESECNINDNIFVVPNYEPKPVKVMIDYGNCPECGEKVIDNGRFLIWDGKDNILDTFQKVLCLHCENTSFIGGNGSIRFEGLKMIYGNEDFEIVYDLIPFEEFKGGQDDK